MIGGVRTEVVEPRGGVAPENRRRVLINVHGGAFIGGARTLSRVESMPIAAIGRIKVISVECRQGPDFTFPAASEDFATLYRELPHQQAPPNIGLYGGSAGGVPPPHRVGWVL